MVPDISVVICAYTEERWLDLIAAVESIQHQQEPAREIIVVVDHNPSLLERVRARFCNTTVLENREEPGLAGSRNTAIASAQGSVVAFLDDDAVATPNWLRHLNAGYRDPRVLGVGGKIEPRWPRARPRWFPDEFNWVVGCTYRGLTEESAPVRNLIGANMSFRREVFHEVKFFSGIGHNGARPFGGSDPDFCIRVTRRWPKRVLLYEPRALVYHRVNESRTRWSYFRLRCYNEGLSKALLVQRVGSKEGLSSERQHTFRTLPKGVAHNLAAAVRGDRSGVERAATIVAGLAITTTGYLVGVLQRFDSAGTGNQRYQTSREEIAP